MSNTYVNRSKHDAASIIEGTVDSCNAIIAILCIPASVTSEEQAQAGKSEFVFVSVSKSKPLLPYIAVNHDMRITIHIIK